MFNLNFMMSLKGSATKTFEVDQDKVWHLKQNYKAGKYFKGFENPVSDLEEAFDVLEENQNHPCFLIHGGFIEGVEKDGMVRRSRPDNKDGLKPTLVDRHLKMFCVDVDGYDGTIQDFLKELPEEFQTADYIYQYSASYGLTSTELKCHLFFWLKNPVHNIDLREWAKNCGIKAVDPAVYNAAQPVYIQRRVCLGGQDPVEDFMGLVKKEGELDWTPEVTNKIQNKTSISKSEYDLATSVEKILTAENYHSELNGLALSLINRKVPPGTVKSMLKGAMNAASVKDARWQERFDDIDRSVNTAADIVNKPTIDEILEWIEDEPTLAVKSGYATRCLHLSPMDRTTAVVAITKKIGFGVRDVQKTIKLAEDEFLIEQQNMAREAQTRERESRGIHELELRVENSGAVCDSACKILSKSKHKPGIYVIGGMLASVAMDHPKTIRQCSKINQMGRDYPKMPVIQTYKKPYSSLANRLKQDLMLINEKGQDIEPPSAFLNVIGEARHPIFKPLTGIIENPFIDNNWKLIKQTGYNEKTGLFAVLHHKLKITKMDPKVAYEYLAYTVFDEFPFVSDLDRAVAVGALLTAVQRPSICGDSGFPGFGIVSPVQSSGKTTLAQLISYSVFNRPIAATTLSDDEAELSKHLLAILQEGHSCILFDNIKQGDTVTSDVLSRAMSNDIFGGRLLGENKNVEVPSSVVWIFTGNGIKFVGDFATRVYPININPRMEDPNTRSFKREDIGQWAMDNRKKIISAILSIIIAGKDSTQLNGIGATRFKDWDKFVRRPILMASGIDVNDAVKKNQMEDPLKMGKLNLLIQLKESFQQRKFTTKDMMKEAYGAFESGSTDLGDALEEIFGNNAKNSRTIGRYMGAMEGQIFSNLMLEKYVSNVVYWNIKEEV